MDRSQVKAKVRKHNPKPKKVCVGAFLAAQNRELSRLILESGEKPEIQNAEFKIMNIIFLEVAQGWCRCPECMRAANAMIKLFSENMPSDELPKQDIPQ